MEHGQILVAAVRFRRRHVGLVSQAAPDASTDEGAVMSGVGKRSRVIAIVLFLAGCVSTARDGDVTPQPAPFEMGYQSLMNDLGERPPAGASVARSALEKDRDVQNALLPPLNLRPAEEGPTGESAVDPTIDLVITEGEPTQVRDLLLALVEGTRYTMIIHPDVRATVAPPLSLMDTSVREAVDVVCEITRIDCSFTPPRRPGSMGTFRVFPRGLVSRTFKVDYLPISRDGRSSTSVRGGDQTSTAVVGNEVTTTAGGGAGSTVVTDFKSDFWTELEMALRSFLHLKQLQQSAARDIEGNATTQMVAPSDTESEKSVMVNRQAGLVIVRAFPEEMREIENYLEQFKLRSRRQIVLEAKVLEVELSDEFRFGVDWVAIHRGVINRAPMDSEPSGGDTFTSGGTVITEGPAALFTRETASSPFSLALRTSDFVGFIDMLEAQGTVQVLSSPRVVTTNNQKALIKVGEDEVFITDININEGDNGTESTVDPQLQFLFSGVALDVTPQVGEDGWVTLHIHPMVTEVVDKVKSYVFNGQTQEYPLALTKSREVDSVIRARTGEVVVIGGLMRRERRHQDDGVPLLNQLPVLGPLFEYRNRQVVTSELVILLRPVVVDDRDGWDAQIRNTAERIREFKPDPELWR
ncbi:MAG: pilus (MSHA type) biogenesis protein MshL [Magnetococcus sp. WYHC-3]